MPAPSARSIAPARWIGSSGSAPRHWAPAGLAVLTYHSHRRLQATRGELDPGVFDTTPDELAEELAILRAYATVVSLADVRRFFHGRRLPPNPVLVTFDDGYADAATQAVPILRRAGVPATFFVATAFPDAGCLFWWDRIWLLMRRCRRPRVELAYPTRLVIHPPRGVDAAAHALIDVVKRTPRLDVARFWDGLEQASGVTLDAAEERALAARTLLGWSAVRRLRSAGMDVQSHSHEHFVLNGLSPETVQRDLAALGPPPPRSARRERPSAWPTPSATLLHGLHHDAPGAAGFELGFTNSTGLCAAELGPTPSTSCWRISMDLGISARRLRGAAALRRRRLVPDGPASELAPADHRSRARATPPSPASAEARRVAPGAYSSRRDPSRLLLLLALSACTAGAAGVHDAGAGFGPDAVRDLAAPPAPAVAARWPRPRTAPTAAAAGPDARAAASFIRYLALGDSFTAGTGSTPADAFPVRLAERLRARGVPVTLENLGVNGYTTDDLVARELPRLVPFAPTMVTLAIGANDLVHGRKHRWSATGPRSAPSWPPSSRHAASPPRQRARAPPASTGRSRRWPPISAICGRSRPRSRRTTRRSGPRRRRWVRAGSTCSRACGGRRRPG